MRFVIFATLFCLSSFAFANINVDKKPSTLSRKPQNLSAQYYNFERVIDGDTFIASGLKIRLWGIDAPEKGEPLYKISSKALELFLEDGKLSCKFIETDPYQRLVMYCYSNNRDIGALMVKAGFARDFKKYSGGFYQEEENFAKAAKLGIWE